MRSTLILNQKPPYSTQATREAIDAALASAVFGVNTALLFLGDGVWQLKQGQSPDQGNLKRTLPLFESLALYDIQDVFVCEDDLNQRGLAPQDLAIAVKLVSPSAIIDILQQYDNIISY